MGGFSEVSCLIYTSDRDVWWLHLYVDLSCTTAARLRSGAAVERCCMGMTTAPMWFDTPVAVSPCLVPTGSGAGLGAVSVMFRGGRGGAC